MRSRKKNLVVSSVAMPDGTMQPTRPCAESKALELGEDRIGVDVAAAAERIAARGPQQLALPLCLALVGLERE